MQYKSENGNFTERLDKEVVRTLIQYLWAQNTEPVNIHRQIVPVYGAYVVSFQRVWKWYCGFANGG
jgi:hypothetical protein